jgi:formylglycine-generating enzyme required for sulfatase activity
VTIPTIVSPTTLPPPPPKALTFQGNLQVNVNVDQANVFLNNQFIGVANKGKPLNKTGVQSGKMNLRVEASGHMVFSQVVHVETNAWTQISAILNPLTTQDPPQPAALPSSDNEWVEPFTEMIFIQIPGSCFQMGSNHKRSGPIHEVCVGDFYLGKYEVTQGEWQKVMGRNPSKSKNSSRHPVEMVSYYDIQEFITNLNSKGNTNFRLPYEAEWEYAAKGGKRQFQYSTKNGSINSSSVNFDSEGIFSIGFLLRSSEDGFKHSAPVGSSPLNYFSIADMTGNLWEWVHDYFGKAYYASSAKNNPKGPEKGKYRIFRGGSWNDSNVDYLSTSFRYLKKPGYKNNTVGFRLAIQN